MIWHSQGFKMQICSDRCKKQVKALINSGSAHYKVRDPEDARKWRIRVLPSWAQGLTQSLRKRRCFICQKEIPDGRGGRREKKSEYEGVEPLRPVEARCKIVLQGTLTVQRFHTLCRYFHDLTRFSPNVKGQGKNCTVSVLGYKKTKYGRVIYQKPFSTLDSPCIWHEFKSDVINRKWLHCEHCKMYILVRDLYRIELSIGAINIQPIGAKENG